MYGYLIDRLSVQDADGTSRACQPRVSSQYQQLFMAFVVNMLGIAPLLANIASGGIGLGRGDLTLVHDNWTRFFFTETRGHSLPVRL